jgi:hypothetical protein
MKLIQVIELDGRPVAIAVAGRAIVDERVPASQLERVQAKALYALRIQADELPGPYTDAGAEQHARDVATMQARRQRRQRRRGSHSPRRPHA